MKLFQFIFLFIFFINFDSVKAQITDTTFFYSGSLTSRISRGNLNQFLLNTSVHLEQSIPKIGFRFSSNTFHLWLNGNQLDDDFIENLVIYANPMKKISPYLVIRYEESLRRGLESKYMTGLGVSYQWLSKKNHHFRLSGNLMYDKTRFSNSDLHLLGLENSVNRTVWRPTLFFTGKNKLLNGEVNISYEVWFQSSLERIDDFRTQINLNVDERVYKGLFIRMQLFYFYEAILPVEKKRNDLRISFGIVLKRA